MKTRLNGFAELIVLVLVLASLSLRAESEKEDQQKTHPRSGALGQIQTDAPPASSPTTPAPTGAARTPDPARQRAWEEANRIARKRVADFDAAVKSGDPDRIRRAALDLQSDPLAVQQLNRGSEDLIRAHNQVTDQIKAQTRQNIRERMAREWNQRHPNDPIQPDDVEIFEPTNRRSPSERPKAGQDWDVTVRVKGRDVPPSESRRIVNDSYFEAAGGEATFGKGTTPDQAARRQSIETTYGKSPEAYSDAERLGVSGSAPDPTNRLQDPEQLTHATQYKSNEPANSAAEARARGNELEGVRQEFEEIRQAVKQYDRIQKPRVEASGGQVHEKVEKGMDVLRGVAEGRLSPEEARTQLAEMGETPESIISKASGQAEAAQKLRPGGADGIEGAGRTGTAAPEGGARGTGDLGDSPGRRTELPDKAPRGPTDAPDVKEKIGKGLKAVGTGLEVVDVGSTLEDLKEGLKEGDPEKIREAGLNAADNFTGGAIGTGRTMKQRLVDARTEKNEAQDEARRAAQEAWEQEIRRDLRRAGYSREEADRMVENLRSGNDQAVRDAYQRMGRDLPEKMQTDPTVGETLKNYGAEVVENTTELAKGVAEKGEKTKRFIKEAVQDTFEIGTGLTEKGVARELVEQQKERLTMDNLTAGLEHVGDVGSQVIGAKPTDAERVRDAIDRLAEKLMEKGVPKHEARELAKNRIENPSDPKAAQDIRDALQRGDKKPGQTPETRTPKTPNQTDTATSTGGRENGQRPGQNNRQSPGSTGRLPSGQTREKADKPDPNAGKTADGRDDRPRDDAGRVVDASAYRPGDLIITRDGTEYVNKGGRWVPTGRNYGTYSPDRNGLKDAEGGSGTPSEGRAAADSPSRGNGGVLDLFSGSRDQSRGDQVASASGLMTSQQQMTSAATAGESQQWEAGMTRDRGGRESQNIRDTAARDAAQKQRDQSWGREIGDAVVGGIQKGAEAFGSALGGAAAEKASGAIFGPPRGSDSAEGPTKSGSDVASAGAGKSVAPPSGGRSSTPNKDGKGGRRKTSEEGSTTSTTAGTAPPGPTDAVGTVQNPDGTVTITYGCGYSWTGKPPGPPQCPVCGRETVSTKTNPPPAETPTTVSTPATPPAPPPPAPPAEKPKRTRQIVRCPCGSTDVTPYESRFGPAYKCRGCGGSIKAYAMIYETVEE